MLACNALTFAVEAGAKAANRDGKLGRISLVSRVCHIRLGISR